MIEHYNRVMEAMVGTWKGLTGALGKPSDALGKAKGDYSGSLEG